MPSAIEELVGVMEIELRVTALLETVMRVAPLTDPEVAITLVVPADTPVVNPVEESTLAIEGLVVVQVTESVIRSEVPSEYCPIATKASLPPVEIVELIGVT